MLHPLNVGADQSKRYFISILVETGNRPAPTVDYE
jgi:hypothetical protein